jgi:hypothetical protein
MNNGQDFIFLAIEGGVFLAIEGGRGRHIAIPA